VRAVSVDLLTYIHEAYTSAALTTFERVICGEKPGERADRRGMDLVHDMGDVDRDLAGMLGVHTGDADEWLAILADDGYCHGTARVYNIEIPGDCVDFFVADDPHVTDKTENPDSWILFSPTRTHVPAAWVRLVKSYSERQLTKLVRDAHKEEDEGGPGW
jgi:hypothetical protein